MKKVELLSPAGNSEMLKQAIHNGCDAVYLAGTNYGARHYAKNFSNEELIEAINYAHLYDVKVYVTINTLIMEDEVDAFLNYVSFLYQNNVDAVLMQDIGMIELVRIKYPNLEIHASTQAHNYSIEGIKYLKSLGVTRAVLARELSLSEIKNITIDIQKEVFVYGALCVCYSGQCLFSSLNGGRSGNRGECVGSCRLPYKLLNNNEEITKDYQYLLSMKELNTLSNLKEIIASGVDSLKIEGRMKSPYYVGYVTRLYRKLIDKYYLNEDMSVKPVEINNLKKLFNREFTNGFLLDSDDLTNLKAPNHQGITIGKVINKDYKYIYIELSDELNQEDGIRFANSDKGMIVNRLYNKDKVLVNSVSKGIALVDNRFDVMTNDIILKTTDKKLITELEMYHLKKIDIIFQAEFKLNQPFVISISDGINEIKANGEIVTLALKHEVTKDNILNQLNKVNDTPFRVKNIAIIKDDNIFINLKSINEVRRLLIQELIAKRKYRSLPKICNEIKNSDYIKSDGKFNLNILVRNESQLICCLGYNVNNIYVTDYELYLKYKSDKRIFYRLNRILNNYKKFNGENLLISDFGAINKYKDSNNLVSDYYLNVTNSHSIKLLNANNVNRVILSVELAKEQISEIMKENYNVEIVVYGRVELMIMKYCVVKKCLGYCNKCFDKSNNFYLLDQANNKYPLIIDNCLTHILHYKNIDNINLINEYKKMGVNNYCVQLFDENDAEIKRIIERILEIK